MARTSKKFKHRTKIPKGKSKKLFTKASRVHKRNAPRFMMRGGVRL